MTQEELQGYLTNLIKCESRKDPSVRHEFVFGSKADAVRVANYLRGHGYVIELKKYKPAGLIMYYVGVPFTKL